MQYVLVQVNVLDEEDFFVENVNDIEVNAFGIFNTPEDADNYAAKRGLGGYGIALRIINLHTGKVVKWS